MTDMAFTVTFGVIAGYNHENLCMTDRVEIVSAFWQKHMNDVKERTGIRIGGVVQSSIVSYSPDDGCPENGEIAVTISGVFNSYWQDDYYQWLEKLQTIVKNVKKDLNQKTVTLVLSPATVIYMNK